MDISFMIHVAADGTTTVMVEDLPDIALTVAPAVPTAERDAQIVAWVDARRAEAVALTP